MGLPIMVIEDWPDDRVIICGRKLAAGIKGAFDQARQIAEKEKHGARSD